MLPCHGESTLGLRAQVPAQVLPLLLWPWASHKFIKFINEICGEKCPPHVYYLQLLSTANGRGLCSRLGTLIKETGQLRILLILSSTLGRDLTTPRLSMCLRAFTKLSGQVLPLLLGIESSVISHSKGFLIVSRHQSQLAAATEGLHMEEGAEDATWFECWMGAQPPNKTSWEMSKEFTFHFKKLLCTWVFPQKIIFPADLPRYGFLGSLQMVFLA